MIYNHKTYKHKIYKHKTLNRNGNRVVQESATLTQARYKSAWLHFEAHRVDSNQECCHSLLRENAIEPIRQIVLLK